MVNLRVLQNAKMDSTPDTQSVVTVMGQKWGERIVIMLEYIILYAFMLVRFREPGLDRHDAKIKGSLSGVKEKNKS